MRFCATSDAATPRRILWTASPLPGSRAHEHQYGFNCGPAGDTVEGFEASLRKAIALDPENITVHTLTLKRASNIVVEHRAADYADVAAMLNKCSLLADAGYRPYYNVPPEGHAAKSGKYRLGQARF